MTKRDRITQIRIQNFRCIADLTLKLDGLTVLIGDNGSGKSAIIEAIELIYQAAQPGDFIDKIGRFHGGHLGVVRQGQDQLTLEVTIEDAERIESCLVYRVCAARQGNFVAIVAESLIEYPQNKEASPIAYIQRERDKLMLRFENDQPKTTSSPMRGELSLANLRGWPHPILARTIEALEGIQAHKPFAVQALWSAFKMEMHHPNSPRWPKILEPTNTLEHGATNLADCFHTLRNHGSIEDWARVLGYVRLGLGDEVTNVGTFALDQGRIYLTVSFRNLPKPTTSLDLSDGQLSYLAFVALTELSKHYGSLVAFDEPENHLHPQLAARVLWLFEELSKVVPVILATHSDRLLDALEDPAKSVVLCELDENRAMVIRRPNKEALDLWLKDYRGIGHLRSENLEPFIYYEPLKEPITEPLPSPNAAPKAGNAQ